MALLPNINVGTSPNDGTGDSIRDAFTIVNENFQLIEAFFPNSSVANLVANIESTGTSVFNIANANIITVSNLLTASTINAATIGNSGATLTGNLSTNTQPNITSLGTLTGLTVNGDITANVIGNSGSTLTGTLATASQPNVTTVGTLTSLDVSGTIQGGNLSTGGTIFSEFGISSNTSLSVPNLTVTGSLTTNIAYRGTTYTISDSDYTIIANVTSNTSANFTLPNADTVIGREIRVVYWDRDAVNTSATEVNVNVGPSEPNITVGPTSTSQTSFAWNNTVDPAKTFLATGLGWFLI
jgi:hypothetical protein